MGSTVDQLMLAAINVRSLVTGYSNNTKCLRAINVHVFDQTAKINSI